MASRKFEQSLVNDVIPYVEKNYRVKAGADHRAITGFSMGGFQTQNITNANPALFRYIGVMSMGLPRIGGAYDQQAHVAQLQALKASSPKAYYVFCGKTDFLYASVTELRALYEQIGINYVYRESEGGHTWMNWRRYLGEFAPLLFK